MGLQALKAKVLLPPDAHDQLLLPQHPLDARDILKKLHREVDCHEPNGPNGHLDGITEIAQVGQLIAEFPTTKE